MALRCARIGAGRYQGEAYLQVPPGALQLVDGQLGAHPAFGLLAAVVAAAERIVTPVAIALDSPVAIARDSIVMRVADSG
jgi:hypothetical protein